MNREENSVREKTALIVGATGIVGHSLAEHLVRQGWKTFGVARWPSNDIKGLVPIAANLLDASALRGALKEVRPTHVFYATWSRHHTEAENIRVNGAMMRNLLDALRPQKSIEHFAAVTGLKHYIGPFELYAKGAPPPTPFRETLPRLDIPNFYYTLEDEVFAAAEQDGFGWSVHRPHTMIGYAKRNVMNMGTTLAVYAAFCRETGRPFAFPGNEVQWNGLTERHGCPPPRKTSRVGRDNAGSAESGPAYRQRRRFPMELDVGTPRRVVRLGGSTVFGRDLATGGSDGRRQAHLGRHRAPGRTG